MLYDYEDDTHTHEFKEGEIIQVVSADEHGWLAVLRSNGEQVYFPASYCEPVNKDRTALNALLDPLDLLPTANNSDNIKDDDNEKTDSPEVKITMLLLLLLLICISHNS